ncbi:MAG TPA: response regulator [Dehalococcoidia bacterium]|nr:response regulator [Dehalococcoidia bacterium]
MDKKVLVIEDDPASLKLMQYALTQHGYEVLIASNGSDGLNKARTEGPDLVILSVMLPGMDGFEVCHRLRTEGDSLPIVMLSDKAREADMATGFKLGANDYLIKPVSPSTVINVVDSLMVLSPVKVESARLEKYIGY